MQVAQRIDLANLLGFDTIGSELSDGVDFKDEAVSGKLGAKVGTEVLVALDAVFSPTDAANSRLAIWRRNHRPDLL